MSTIYKFQDSEAVVTSTTTSLLLRAADAVLVNASGKAGQSNVGSIATLWPTATTTSSLALVAPYGVTSITPGSTTQAFVLSTATQVGQCVTVIYNCTSTSSQNVLNTASTAAMTFASTETYAGITVTFNQIPKAYVELTAVTVSTANSVYLNPNVWMITGRSASGTLCT